jgi:hypothetical protein
MRVRLFLSFALGVLSLTPTAFGQIPVQPPTVSRPDGALTAPVIRRADGGAYGPMQSIFISPKAGAPFSLMLAAEWTRPMGNGGTFTMVNERRIVRDSKGRIYQERWILVPKGGKVKSQMNVFQITDPELHTWFNCEVGTKICELLQYRLTTEQKYLPATAPSGPLPNGNGFRTHEDLGTGSTQGVDTHGYRDTTTINEGVMGNDKPMVTMREFWWSPQLAINLLSTVDEPQSGKQIFTVKELSTSEPDLSYFEIPAGYTVVDHRNENSTPNN